MFNEKFKEVLNHEGTVAIVSWNGHEANVTNTWNSYVQLDSDNKMLIPAAGMKSTEEDISVINKLKITLGSKEVEGTQGMGAGFYLEGTAAFLQQGQEYDLMKERFPWMRKVLAVTVDLVKQTI